MTASRHCVLLAGLMSALSALFRGGPVTLGCSFMVIGSRDVCISWHKGIPLLLLYCTMVPSTGCELDASVLRLPEHVEEYSQADGCKRVEQR